MTTDHVLTVEEFERIPDDGTRQELDGTDVLPGFRVKVSRIFGRGR